MSAGLSAIGPVSVRYAMQIKDLLDTQAIKRMAAAEEAARAADAAERAARVEAIRNASTSYEPVKVDVKTGVESKTAEKTEAAVQSYAPQNYASNSAEPSAPIATAEVAAGQFVDEIA
jgi:CRISPR/Cas system type I-B associated protein Csh2 (Cas7 group RAMP superfamily)